jgi:hypothetical protein
MARPIVFIRHNRIKPGQLGFEIYGDAGDQIVEGMRSEAAEAGATLTLMPYYVTGFLRLAPG